MTLLRLGIMLLMYSQYLSTQTQLHCEQLKSSLDRKELELVTNSDICQDYNQTLKKRREKERGNKREGKSEGGRYRGGTDRLSE